MRTQWTKRFAAVAVAALAVAACGGDDDDAADNGGPATQAPVATSGDGEPDGTTPDGGPATTAQGGEPTPTTPSAAGGVLRYVQTSEPATLNPVKSVIGDAAIWGSIIERIIAIDENLLPTDEGLVTAWESTDPNTWRFTLREGIEFSNGEPWNAEAFEFSIEEYRDNPESIMKGYVSNVTDVVVVDELTADVVSASPNAAIPNILASLFALPPAYYAEVGADGFAQAPIGTGPFLFANYSPGVSIEVTANEDYWRGRPSLDGLHFSWAPDEASRLALLEAGDADVVDALSVRSANSLEGSADFTVAKVESRRSLPFYLVDSKPPLDDIVVREAVVRAIDRQAIVDAVFEGTGAVPVTGILSPFSPDIEAPADLYDPDRARELIASLPEVPTIPIHFQVGRITGDADVAEVIAGMLEEVGFKVERDPQEYANLVQSIIGGEVNGLFDTASIPVFSHPDAFANAFLSPTVSLTKSCINYPELDTMKDQAVAEFDLAAANAIYSEMDRIATSEHFCVLPTYHEVRHWGVSNAVAGFVARPDTIPDWYLASF